MKSLRINLYGSRYKFFTLTLLISLLIGVEDCFGLVWSDSINVFSLVDNTFVSKKDLENFIEHEKKDSNKKFNTILLSFLTLLMSFLTLLLKLFDLVDRKVTSLREKKQRKINFFRNFLRRIKC